MRLVRLFLGCLAAAIVAGAARAEPALWTIRDPDSTIVIFGSVHVLPPPDDWRPAALDAALAQADDLWFEVPLDAAAQAQIAELVASRSLLPPGETLRTRLPPQDAERLERVAGRLGLYTPGLARLQPWMAEMTLSLTAGLRGGGDANAGVERRLDATTPASVRRRYFETVAEQIESLAGGPEPLQIASLAATLQDLDEQPQGYARTVALWRAGDVRGLDAEALAPLRRAAPQAYDRVIVQRNRRWVAAVRARLAGSGRTVMVVGVGHLVGPNNLIALLRAQGITVEGP